MVNGATSLLSGNIAVAGNAAHVVIANPNGIECQGVAFRIPYLKRCQPENLLSIIEN